jgi:hypothetical protein
MAPRLAARHGELTRAYAEPFRIKEVRQQPIMVHWSVHMGTLRPDAGFRCTLLCTLECWSEGIVELSSRKSNRLVYSCFSLANQLPASSQQPQGNRHTTPEC